jgi:tRNA threonylcarbamoyladenosine biosynthesis protein TsaB
MTLNCIMPQCTADFPELADKLNGLGRPVCFLGDGVPVFREMAESLVKVPFYFAPAGHNRQRAVCVAIIAEQYVRDGTAPDGRGTCSDLPAPVTGGT